MTKDKKDQLIATIRLVIGVGLLVAGMLTAFLRVEFRTDAQGECIIKLQHRDEKHDEYITQLGNADARQETLLIGIDKRLERMESKLHTH